MGEVSNDCIEVRKLKKHRKDDAMSNQCLNSP